MSTVSEQPLFIQTVSSVTTNKVYTIVDVNAPTASEEQPIRLEQIWNDSALFPATQSAFNSDFAPPLADGAIVSTSFQLRLSRPLVGVNGSERTFMLASNPGDLALIVPPTFAPNPAGSLAGLTRVVQETPTGCAPVIVDATGAEFVADSKWVFDWHNNIVQFPTGTPEGMTLPISITFLSYVGPTGGAGGGGGGTGDVSGPPLNTATDNAVVRFNSITGKNIQNSSVIIGDLGEVSGVSSLSSTSVTTDTVNINAGGSVVFGLGATISGTGVVPDTAIVAVSASKISGTITNAQIGAGAVTSGKLAAASVTDAAIADGAISGAKLTSDSVPTDRLVHPGNTTQYLRADGSWATPSGAGDVAGPGSSLDKTIPIFSGSSGKLLADSAVSITGTSNDGISAVNVSATNLTATSTFSAPAMIHDADIALNTIVASTKLNATGATADKYLKGDDTWGGDIITSDGAIVLNSVIVRRGASGETVPTASNTVIVGGGTGGKSGVGNTVVGGGSSSGMSASATYNTLIGSTAGSANLINGNHNTFVGASAGNNAVDVSYSTAIGPGTITNGSHSIAIGSIGTLTVGAAVTKATGTNTIALGPNTAATGNYAIAIGSDDGSGTSSNFTQAIGDNSIAIGKNTQTPAQNSVAMGTNSIVNNSGSSSAIVLGNSAAVGESATAAASAIAIGNTATVKGGSTNSIAIGRTTTVKASATGCIAIGSARTNDTDYEAGISGTAAGGMSAIAIGCNVQARGLGSVAIGSDGTSVGNGNATTRATSSYSIAIGSQAASTNLNSIAMGAMSASTGQSSVSVGYGATSGSDNAISLGTGASANNLIAIAIGASTVSSGSHSVAMGYLSQATGNYAIAIGTENGTAANNTVAASVSSISIGTNSKINDASSTGSISIGLSSSVNSSANCVVIGPSAKVLIASSYNSVVVGPGATSSANGSVAIGSGANTSTASTNSIAIGTGATSSAADELVVMSGYILGSNAAGIQHFSPANDIVVDLGKSDKRWKTVYGDAANFTGATILSGAVTVNNNVTISGTRTFSALGTTMSILSVSPQQSISTPYVRAVVTNSVGYTSTTAVSITNTATVTINPNGISAGISMGTGAGGWNISDGSGTTRTLLIIFELNTTVSVANTAVYLYIDGKRYTYYATNTAANQTGTTCRASVATTLASSALMSFQVSSTSGTTLTIGANANNGPSYMMLYFI